jgi:hypothetical protein
MLEDEQLPFGLIDDGQPEEGILSGPEDISEYINSVNRDRWF